VARPIVVVCEVKPSLVTRLDRHGKVNDSR
jgi:hypothetical protein